MCSSAVPTLTELRSLRSIARPKDNESNQISIQTEECVCLSSYSTVVPIKKQEPPFNRHELVQRNHIAITFTSKE